MAEKYHPIPWSSLHYNETENAYVVNYTKAQLQAAPAASIDELTSNDGEAYRDKSYDERIAPVALALRHLPASLTGGDHPVARPPCVVRQAVDRAADECGEQEVVGRPPFGRCDLCSAGDRHPAATVDRHRVFEHLCVRRHALNRTGSVRSRSYCPAQ